MKRRKRTTTTKDYTVSMAQQVLTTEMYDNQRSQNASAIIEYALAMVDESFRPGTRITFAVYKGRRFLINGQHTLLAIVRSGVTAELDEELICFDEDEYEEIAEWYATFDAPGNARSLPQRYAPFKLDHALNFNKQQVKDLGACLPLFAAGFAQVPKTQGGIGMYTRQVPIRLAFMREWVQEAGIYFQLTRGANKLISPNLRRAPIMSICLVLLRFTGTDAEEFIQKFVFDDGLGMHDPCKALHTFITHSRIGEYEAHTYTRYLATSWNADFDDRTIQNFRPMSDKDPLLLKGTPHTGKDTLRYVSPQGEVLEKPMVYTPELWQQEMFHEQQEA